MAKPLSDAGLKTAGAKIIRSMHVLQTKVTPLRYRRIGDAINVLATAIGLREGKRLKRRKRKVAKKKGKASK